MKMTFRWYGENDPVTLRQIAQIPCMSGIVSAVYDQPAGEVWSTENIEALKKQANGQGLEFEVVESVPVPEAVKLGLAEAPQLLENYRETLHRLGKAGVKVVCYNFMPVFDWLRSRLKAPLPDGSNSLAYAEEDLLAMNPLESELSLPGWDESYTRDELAGLIAQYKDLGEEGLWANLEAFLQAVIPAAEESGIRMAIHPDDPPWGLFGLPRIITDEKNLMRFLRLVNSEANGITFCTGSLGASRQNDLPTMIRRFAGRIPFVHLRNIKHVGVRDFQETAHPSRCGSLDMYEIVKALYETGFDGYIRPDHGRMIWGEEGRPGYGLYDRALGAAYLTGLWEAVQRGNA